MDAPAARQGGEWQATAHADVGHAQPTVVASGGAKTLHATPPPTIADHADGDREPHPARGGEQVGPAARAASAREPPFARPLSVHDFLDAFYMARVGIRVLIGQYLELHRLPHPPGYVGLINRCAPPLRMAQPFDWAACAR